MPEYKDQIPPTGGRLTISANGMLEYVHHNRNHAAMVELTAEDGVATGFSDFLAGVTLARGPRANVIVPSDAEGMFGRCCPSCRGVFRASHLSTELCPYCDHVGKAHDFLTAAHREFVKAQYDAILEVHRSQKGMTIDFDGRIEKPMADDAWIINEQKNQTHFKCKCRTTFDVLGEFVRCPSCGEPTARQVTTQRLDGVKADFDRDAASIPKDAQNREVRTRRWRSYVPICVSEFEAVARYMVRYLSQFPLTAKRRKCMQEISPQSLALLDGALRDVFDIDIFDGFTEGDRECVIKMFKRRHLFAHCGGVVDQEYLNNTGDSSVRLHERVDVRSREVARTIELTQRLAANLIEGVESLG